MAKIKKQFKKWIKSKLKNTYLEFAEANKQVDEEDVLYFPYKGKDENYIIRNTGMEPVQKNANTDCRFHQRICGLDMDIMPKNICTAKNRSKR
ncbi:MAG: hypothetical protein IPG99_07355 [Ignavibacteria bacterium]|nr:hypothetical protein [Ignavibacteria bacterium]